MQAADRLFLCQLHDGGPRCTVCFGAGRPQGEAVCRDGFDLFVLRIKIPCVFERLKERCPFIGPPEFTVADGNVFLASGLGKETDRGAQPYAFVVVFGREDAGVRLSVRCELAGLMSVAVSNNEAMRN